MPGNPDPQKSGKRVKFQISREKLENGLSTPKSSPGSILISLQYKQTTTLVLRRFLGFSNFPLMGVNLFWKFRILKKAFLRPAGPLAFEIYRGPKNAERHEGLNAVANNWISIFLTSACLGTLTPKNLEKGSNFRFHLKNLKIGDDRVFAALLPLSLIHISEPTRPY